MKVGQAAITTGPRDGGTTLHRMFGYVADVVGDQVIIRLANGRTVRRSADRVAVYTRTPPHWEKLYQGIEAISQREPLPKSCWEEPVRPN